MKIHFLVPPPALRVGGLDGAIDGLRQALIATGVEVADGLPAAGDREAVVHLHGLWQWPFQDAARRCRAAGIPYVISPHGMLEPWAWRHKRWKKLPYFYLFEKGLLRGAARVLATAEPEARRLREMLPGAKVAMLPLGTTGDAQPDYAAARQELGWPEDERVLLFLSRIHPKKGLDLLLRALTDAPSPGPARLVVVGDGEPEYVKSLQDWIAANSARLPRVDWVGPVWGPARWRYFQGADLLTLPTHSENFGLVVLEAWQCGTPVMTTPGTPWAALLPGRGFVCEPEAGSIAGALRNFWPADRPGDGNRQELSHWVEQEFSWARLAPRYLEVYAEALRS